MLHNMIEKGRVTDRMLMTTTVTVCIALLVSLVEANYEFTIRFYEFRNPLGLQCGACESGGAPVCCDDVQRTKNCTQVKPFTCDTRFRFELMPHGSAVETAPNGGFPYYTRSNGGNSDTFKEGPGGFLALPNPFTITSQHEWTGKIQFFIDALDKAVTNRNETEAIINRFPIDLQLEPGANFTKRRTYTGIYNIPDQGFDLSFRVQCSENFYGSMCTEYCEPILGVYEGKAVCVHNSTNCKTPIQSVDVYQGSSASVIALGILFAVSVVTNIILVIVMTVQRCKSKQKHNQPATDRTCANGDMIYNDSYSYVDSDPRSPDKPPQEAIYYVYENVASGTPLLNQGTYDYVDPY